MESNTTPNNRLKIILVITLVLLFGTGFYTLNLYNSNIETQEQLIAEKELVLKDLNNMAAQYDIAIDNNDVANNKLIQARERIEGLMDSLKISDNNVRSLWRYKKKFLVLQDEMKELMLENNTLKEENSMLTNTLDSTKVQLNDRIVYNDSLLNQNTQLATIVRDASVLSAVSLKGLGVIIRSSGKLIPTERASRADELKICYTVPKNKLVVFTGVSGSGKSSLAFDTIYNEGQRRYMESFGAYARQFMGDMERPDVDKITGLSPVISIEQKTTNKNPRSTVGTVTEVYDFLRLLYARIGEAYSYNTGKKMVKFTEEEIVASITEKYANKKIVLFVFFDNKKSKK